MHLRGAAGILAIITLFFGPGVLLYVWRGSLVWIFVSPIAIFVLLALLNQFAPRRKVTPEHFGEELERHLLGTEEWDWDDVISVPVADARLERIRQRLPVFDTLVLEEERIEFARIVACLKRVEIPDLKINGADDRN
jgi:hypothetical protein